jgi:hypothetical protein
MLASLESFHLGFPFPTALLSVGSEFTDVQAHSLAISNHPPPLLVELVMQSDHLGLRGEYVDDEPCVCGGEYSDSLFIATDQFILGLVIDEGIATCSDLRW